MPELSIMHDSTHGLVDHFFRREYGKLVSMLCGVFGIRNIERVEDMVQAAFVEALHAWRVRGVPNEPAKWVYRVAKNRMIDEMRREETAARLAPQWHAIRAGDSAGETLDELFLDSHLEDSLLRMIFACCHPAMVPEDRVAVTLRSLCGFSNAEIARALLVQEASVRKRIYRAKQLLMEHDITLEVPPSNELPNRLAAVHQVLYLMFNEGYCPSHGQAVVREDVCEEAARLCHLLCEHPDCSIPSTNALLALMLFQAARLAARIDASGGILLLEDQDRSKWDKRMIQRANWYLARSYEQREVTPYHLEAAIAMYHCTAKDFAHTPWKSILELYDALIARSESPVYLLNRAIVIAQLNGPQAGIKEVESVSQHAKMQDYHLVDATLGELHARAGTLDLARTHFRSALEKRPSPAERELLIRKLEQL